MKTSDILPAQNGDPRQKLAKALALKRLDLPTAEFIVLYNEVRQEVAPSLNQVDSVRYLPKDVMELFLDELDRLKHPQPEPLPALDQKALDLGHAILNALKFDPEVIAGMVERTLPQRITGLVAEAVGQMRTQLTDEILELVSAPVSPTAQGKPIQGDPAQSARAFSVAVKPKACGGTFKIMIVDSMIQKILREIELQKPANVRLVIQNADHNPPGTLPRPHYFLISNRTPIIWVQAYKNLKQRMIDIGDKPGVEAYVEQLTRISQLPWFEA